MLSYGHGHTDYYPGVDAFDVIVQAYCEDCDYTFEAEVSVERTEWQTECPICDSKCKGELDE
jgi:predicted Zn-ribbon and HTH transcriptional regulator